MKKVNFVFDESFHEDINLSILSCCIFEDNNFYNDLKKIIKKINFSPGNEFNSDFPHYVNDHPNTRVSFLNEINKLTFKSYISFTDIAYTDKYELYQFLFSPLIENLIRKYKRTTLNENFKICFYFENLTDKIRRDEDFFNKIINNLSLQKYNNEIKVIKKEDFMASIPDYVLGVIGQFLRNEEIGNEKCFAHSVFETIIRKIGYILFLNDGGKEHYHISKNDERNKFIKKFDGYFNKKNKKNL